MKIRCGFVSNSSSSSFCIYGAYVTDLSGVAMTETCRERGCHHSISDDANFCGRCGAPAWIEEEEELDFYDICDSVGLECHYLEDGGYCVGLSYVNGFDSETFANFKARVAEAVENLIGTSVTCKHIEETVYC